MPQMQRHWQIWQNELLRSRRFLVQKLWRWWLPKFWTLVVRRHPGLQSTIDAQRSHWSWTKRCSTNRYRFFSSRRSVCDTNISCGYLSYLIIPHCHYNFHQFFYDRFKPRVSQHANNCTRVCKPIENNILHQYCVSTYMLIGSTILMNICIRQ